MLFIYSTMKYIYIMNLINNIINKRSLCSLKKNMYEIKEVNITYKNN